VDEKSVLKAQSLNNICIIAKLSVQFSLLCEAVLHLTNYQLRNSLLTFNLSEAVSDLFELLNHSKVEVSLRFGVEDDLLALHE